MIDLMYVCIGLAAVNAVVAAGLLLVYVGNIREMKSSYTLGLAVFAAFLLVFNATQLFHFVTMMPAFANVGENLMVAEGGLQTGALVALFATTAR